MKNILKIIFIILGIIFFVIIITITVFIIIDPFNLRPLLFNSLPNIQNNTSVNTEGNDKHPLLSEEQEKLLETIGVDVESLPTQITPEMEECFIEALGVDRVKEIMEGAAPSPIDLFKTKGCL